MKTVLMKVFPVLLPVHPPALVHVLMVVPGFPACEAGKSNEDKTNGPRLGYSYLFF